MFEGSFGSPGETAELVAVVCSEVFKAFLCKDGMGGERCGDGGEEGRA
jgi:hypothetical protein